MTMHGNTRPDVTDKATGRTTVLHYVACYLCFAIIIGLVYVVVFVIWRSAIIGLLVALAPDGSWNNVIYLVSMLLLGMAALVLVLAAEPYFRHGVQQGRLLRRFARYALPLVGFGLLGIVVIELILRSVA